MELKKNIGLPLKKSFGIFFQVANSNLFKENIAFFLWFKGYIFFQELSIPITTNTFEQERFKWSVFKI